MKLNKELFADKLVLLIGGDANKQTYVVNKRMHSNGFYLTNEAHKNFDGSIEFEEDGIRVSRLWLNTSIYTFIPYDEIEVINRKPLDL